MTPERREILERVASGDLSPEEAEFLLSAEAGEHPPTQTTTTIRRVRITAGFGAISVVGDADVAEAEIEGVHQAHVDGDTLVISSDFDGVTPGAFAVSLGGRRGRRGRRIAVHTGLGGRGRSAGALRIRINPSLELDASLDAGPLSISGIGAPIRARSSAGPITVDGVVAPVDVAVNAGAIRINGRLDHGDSRVRSDAGAIRIELTDGSSVRISANAALGRVVLPGMKEGGRGFGSTHEVVVGDGDATLRVETAMGSIQVISR